MVSLSVHDKQASLPGRSRKMVPRGTRCLRCWGWALVAVAMTIFLRQAKLTPNRSGIRVAFVDGRLVARRAVVRPGKVSVRHMPNGLCIPPLQVLARGIPGPGRGGGGGVVVVESRTRSTPSRVSRVHFVLVFASRPGGVGHGSHGHSKLVHGHVSAGIPPRFAYRSLKICLLRG